MKTTRIHWKPVLAIGGSILVIMMVGIVGFNLLFGSFATDQIGVLDTFTNEEIISTLSASVLLPEGETPVIATVTDLALLEDNKFFRNAQIDDRVIMYEGAGVVYLFRPSEKKIVEVANSSVLANASVKGISDSWESKESLPPQTMQVQDQILNTAPHDSSTTEEDITDVRIAIYNGTPDDARLQDVTLNILQHFPQTHIFLQTNAGNRNYPSTTIVDISGRYSIFAETLATLLNGTVGTIPQGEQMPDGQILIIIGG